MNWDEQLALFKSAITDSPSKRVDIVCANAGIATGDEVFQTDGGVLSALSKWSLTWSSPARGAFEAKPQST
jgi:hypothetical protein